MKYKLIGTMIVISTLACSLTLVSAKASAVAGPAAEFYVATDGADTNPGTKDKPFATIEKARNAVRAKKDAKENITVWIRGGTYRLSQTLVFSLEDFAPKGRIITYAAYKDEEPILTSGKKITGWKKLEQPLSALPAKAQGKVWVADIPSTKGGAWRFRTLFNGEKPLPRARSRGFNPTTPRIERDKRWTNLDTLHFPKGTLRNWDNLEDVEILIRPNHVWVVNYLGLASVDENTNVAKTTVPATYNLNPCSSRVTSSCWVENVLEVLDQPGEWVLNTQEGKLYLWPEDNAPGDNIIAPRFRELILVEGKNIDELEGDVPVRGLVFKGLTLTCGDRDVWTKADKGIQHDWEMWDKDNSLVRFRGAENCALENCDLRNSSGGGVRVDRYGQNIRIANNNFHNLGGTAVLLCGYGPGRKDVNKNNVVQNNNIQTCSQLHLHNPGVFIWQSGENKILNNHIHDLPYDGLVLSGVRPRYFDITDPVKWTQKGIIPKNLRENMRLIRWDEVGQPKTAAEARRFAHARNNLVQDNEFNDCVQTLGDGNAIYLSCAAEGNIVRRNLVHHSGQGGQQIRFDDDQEKSTVQQNIVIGKEGIALKHNNYIINNVIIDGTIVFKKETESGCRVEHNIVYKRDGSTTFFSKSGKTDRAYQKANADYNLFYSSNTKEVEKFLQQFRGKYGLEKHGIVADPKFVDIDNYDVRLTPDSPAHDLGIKSIDIDKIGLLNAPSFARIFKQGLASTGTGSKLTD